MKLIFDASYLIALIDEKDKWHKIAEEIMEEMLRKEIDGIIFDCVANEVITVIGKRLESKRKDEYKKVIEKASPYLKGERVIKVYKNVEILYDKIISKVIESEGNLSFHDVLIIYSAKKFNLKYIASFDEDFDEVEGLVRIKSKKDVVSGNENSFTL